MNREMTILDCHVHCSLQTDIFAQAAFLTETGTDRACILACSHSRALTLVPQALELKRTEPGRFFVFGAPDLSAYYLRQGEVGKAQRIYGEQLLRVGCDGLKLLEGKPQMRKYHPIPDFDAPEWEEFFVWAEAERVPLLWHVNDPENFWDLTHAPAFAIAQGWLYDESYVNNEAQYAQVLSVLRRHPELRVIFAHFFFLSAQLERLAAVLESFPNVMVDLTPGIEMYESFSAQPEAAARFFERYHDRICYGTDIGGRCVLMGEHKAFDPAENQRRPAVVRRFLTESEPFEVCSDGHYLIDRAPFTMRPLGLAGERLRDIFAGNFLRLVGRETRPLNEAALSVFREELRGKLAEMERCVPGFMPASGDEAG